MNPLIRQQIDLNQSTRSHWESFAFQRQRVTELLVKPDQGAGRLCILGAGNCNDLDLPTLIAEFDQVVLVDLDREALMRGTAALSIKTGDRLCCLADTDVTGALPRIATWSPATRLEAEDLEALAAGARVSDWPPRPQFDVVASTCLLSQLVGSLVHSLTDRHPQFLDAVRAIRTGHFRTLASLLRPGGRAVFISDVVSSDTLPELRSQVAQDSHRLVAAAISVGNFFTGLNPRVVHALLNSDPVVAPLFKDATFVPPWVWHCGPRSYAVYAIEAIRAH
ncbi:hypothetical protein AYO47_00815 [Planctomyces sp. SCGC AG-212-M04]|nr:hypothetical protein AYO47_00815 [Planctomyces sp. SCGC AG-212-M04]